MASIAYPMISANSAGTPSCRYSSAEAIAQADRVFPNLSVALRNDSVRRLVLSRRIEGHSIAHLLTPQTMVDASGKKAALAGFGTYVKLIWQLKGTMRYEDAHRSFALQPGEMLIASMAWTYHLEMDEGYEGLVLIFDPMSSVRGKRRCMRRWGRPTLLAGRLRRPREDRRRCYGMGVVHLQMR
ncbi:hypothetical protein [Bradyrhizobium neotropicale]|uniref:hypothetical protein n=1 Tax=Bradyrhizobium neotropicale TaxID=1497615 RepID=UPI001AD6E02D|nr:hypothetical protein [Bradyrhizobium neotropicale]MBO4223909.1 hypothetical protein [Bradyrhizobium neotropicale]